MKKNIFTLVCLLGTVSNVFASRCEDEYVQREKRTREEMTLVEYVPPLINYTLDDIDAVLFGAPVNQGEPTHKKQCTALPSPRLLTFHDACEKVDPQYKDCVQEVMPVLCIPRYRYHHPYSSDTIPSLEKMCRIVLIKTATCHAHFNNMAPIAYLRRVADTSPLLERAIFKNSYIQNAVSKGPLLWHFSSVYLNLMACDPRDEPLSFMTTSLCLRKLALNNIRSPGLYNHDPRYPFFPNLETLILGNYAPQDLGFLVSFSQLRCLVLENLTIDYGAQKLNRDHFINLSQLQHLKIDGDYSCEEEELYEEDPLLHEELVNVLCHFTSLTKLSLRKGGEDCTACIPNYVGRLTSLEHLTFAQDNGVSHIEALRTLTNLRTLKIDETSVTSLAPLRHLPKLHFVSADWTRVTPESVMGLTQLRYLNLSSAEEEHKWPVASLHHLRGLTNLRALDLRHKIAKNGVLCRQDALAVAQLGLAYFALTTQDLSAETLRVFKDARLHYTDKVINPDLKYSLKYPA